MSAALSRRYLAVVAAVVGLLAATALVSGVMDQVGAESTPAGDAGKQACGGCPAFAGAACGAGEAGSSATGSYAAGAEKGCCGRQQGADLAAGCPSAVGGSCGAGMPGCCAGAEGAQANTGSGCSAQEPSSGCCSSKMTPQAN